MTECAAKQQAWTTEDYEVMCLTIDWFIIVFLNSCALVRILNDYGHKIVLA